MSCGTGECGCGCGEFLHIHVKPEVKPEPTLKIIGRESAAEEPNRALVGNLSS
jgi:hypothetical protein